MAKRKKFHGQQKRHQKYPDVIQERIRQERKIVTMWVTQLSLDVMTGILNDSEVMGKDTFGAERLNRIGKAFNERFWECFKALSSDDEADYIREKIDQQQKQIFGDSYVKWSERYEYFAE